MNKYVPLNVTKFDTTIQSEAKFTDEVGVRPLSLEYPSRGDWIASIRMWILRLTLLDTASEKDKHILRRYVELPRLKNCERRRKTNVNRTATPRPYCWKFHQACNRSSFDCETNNVQQFLPL